MHIIEIATGKYYTGFNTHQNKPVFSKRKVDKLLVSESDADTIIRQLAMLGVKAIKEADGAWEKN